jgi:CheY-like chemotaxis protein
MIKQALNVLIIEDNAALAANIYDYLEACGHHPDAAPDGESGLGLLAINQYDVIVLDWMMPRMDGITMLARLRQDLKSRTPVIVITAKDQVENKIQASRPARTTTSSSPWRWPSWKYACACWHSVPAAHRAKHRYWKWTTCASTLARWK